MNSAAPRKRNFWIWLIIIWSFGSGVLSLFSFFAVEFGAIPLSDAQRAYFDNLGLLDHLAGVLSAALNLLGAITLFKLRKQAVYLFFCAFGISVLLTGWHAVTRGLSGGLVELGIGLGLLGAVCVYVQKLAKEQCLS
ncbi:hypothetical protein [Propionivibrio dicarboxylicus]|uniref:Uncharacterized protein n=1 Tax=Propionivibrio dicarboxylicus TaxID=83767 RepID=A0A1G8GUL9_9RHOO|nr:hypothetical protein [Propionivibrio dicarboxylicus]SDH98115.1 hypothetical protein SAMN05660652_02643 [Propionivibrio dicarboxylicus]